MNKIIGLSVAVVGLIGYCFLRKTIRGKALEGKIINKADSVAKGIKGQTAKVYQDFNDAVKDSAEVIDNKVAKK